MASYDDLKQEKNDKRQEYEKNLDNLLARTSLSERDKQKARIKFKLNNLLR